MSAFKIKTQDGSHPIKVEETQNAKIETQKPIKTETPKKIFVLALAVQLGVGKVIVLHNHFRKLEKKKNSPLLR